MFVFYGLIVSFFYVFRLKAEAAARNAAKKNADEKSATPDANPNNITPSNFLSDRDLTEEEEKRAKTAK